MNVNIHLCLICDRPAARVCIHPKCEKRPFLCGDKCKDQQDLASSIHTHDGQAQFIPLEEMLEKVSSIQDPTHHEHLNSMRKRVNVLIGELDDLMNVYEIELNKLQPQLNGKARRIIECITIKENIKHLKGKDLADLLGKKDVYKGQSEVERLVGEVKGMMEEKVRKLEDVGIGNTFNTQRAEKHLSKGDKLYDVMKDKQALEEYLLARQYSPLQPLYIFRIDYCYDKLNDYQQALKHYEERISMGGEGEDLAKPYNNIGVLERDRGENEKAIEYYSKALELKGDFADSCYGRGIAYFNMNNYQEAVKDFTKAIGINSGDAKYYSNRGNVYYDMERYEDAVKDYTKAIELNDEDDGYYYNRGNTYYYMDNYQEAIEDYTKAIEINGGDERYYGNRGVVYLNMGRYKEAVQDYTRAINIRPDKINYNNRADAYEKMGERKKAREDRESAQNAPE